MLNFFNKTLIKLSYLLLPISIVAIFLLLSSVEFERDTQSFKLNSQTVAGKMSQKIDRANTTVREENGMIILAREYPGYSITEQKRYTHKCCSNSKNTGRLENALFKIKRSFDTMKTMKIECQPVKLEQSN